MSTPSDPTTPSGPQVPTPATPLDSSADQIRQLATQLNQPPYNFDPTTIRKGIVTAIDAGTATVPPTATILFSGDTSSPVSSVRLAAGFGPQIGDTVIVLKQGSDFFILTDIASASNQTASSSVGGWTLASLNAAHSHGGNSNGNVMYRRVLDGGCWKMQWKGALGYGANTSFLASALPADYRPSTRVSILAQRDVNNGGGGAIQFDFNSDGTASIISTQWSTGSAGGESTSSASPGTDYIDPLDSTTTAADGHSHGVVGGHSHTVSSHWHGNGSHIHTASNPSWVGLHGIEYFLG